MRPICPSPSVTESQHPTRSAWTGVLFDVSVPANGANIGNAKTKIIRNIGVLSELLQLLIEGRDDELGTRKIWEGACAVDAVLILLRAVCMSA